MAQNYEQLVNFENSTTHYVKLCARKLSKPAKNDVDRCSDISIGGPSCNGRECPKEVLQEAVNTAVTIEREHTHFHQVAQRRRLSTGHI